MNIDRDIVMQIAKLAKLELSEQEVTLFTTQLQSILEYVEKLKDVNQHAESFSFDEILPSLTRADEMQPGLTQEEALQNAPGRVKNFFKVPRIIP
jgi:aspartyl-tRNA(Asn)/glutamyl-tRNA(Gln) amidotransferase subunit C